MKKSHISIEGRKTHFLLEDANMLLLAEEQHIIIFRGQNIRITGVLFKRVCSSETNSVSWLSRSAGVLK